MPGQPSGREQTPAIGTAQAGLAFVIQSSVNNIAVKQSIIEVAYTRQGSYLGIARAQSAYGTPGDGIGHPRR